MRPFILVVLVIRSMDVLRLFDEGFVLTGGAPARETETLSQLVYTDTFTFFDIGRGSALAIVEGAIVGGCGPLIYIAPSSEARNSDDQESGQIERWRSAILVYVLLGSMPSGRCFRSSGCCSSR